MNNNWLLQYGKNVTSQMGEDGVLEKIFEILGIKIGLFVDVGAYGMHNSNTFSLRLKGWRGIFIESEERRIAKLRRMHGGDNVVICEKVVPVGEKTLDNILAKTFLPKDFEFISIDIDGNDYYIWESLKNYYPIVVAIEFNPTKKFDNYLQLIDGLEGASLSFVVRLGKEKGYELIATTAFNAFFVKKELFDKFEIKDNSIHNMWVENKSTYGNQ